MTKNTKPEDMISPELIRPSRWTVENIVINPILAVLAFVFGGIVSIIGFILLHIVAFIHGFFYQLWENIMDASMFNPKWIVVIVVMTGAFFYACVQEYIDIQNGITYTIKMTADKDKHIHLIAVPNK